MVRRVCWTDLLTLAIKFHRVCWMELTDGSRFGASCVLEGGEWQ